MRADALIETGETRWSPAAIDGFTELLAGLAKVGLVSIHVGDDGVIEYVLTAHGVKAAQQMAMGRDALALVLLGALTESSKDLD